MQKVSAAAIHCNRCGVAGVHLRGQVDPRSVATDKVSGALHRASIRSMGATVEVQCASLRATVARLLAKT